MEDCISARADKSAYSLVSASAYEFKDLRHHLQYLQPVAFSTFSPLRLFTPVDSNQNVQSQLAASVLLYVASLLMRLT
ncbi:MAG TPA: hypothetical protein VIF64_20560 [Pyrinomonadaceae bacterium]